MLFRLFMNNTVNIILHKLMRVSTNREMELCEHSNVNLTVSIHGCSNCQIYQKNVNFLY